MRSRSETLEQRFNRLYQETSDDVLAYLVRRSATLEDAADALAETYAAAWRKINSLPQGDTARLWLFGAARIELRKTASRTRADDELVTRLATELEDAPGHRFATADPDEALWLATSHLSELDREILALTAWEGLAPREIAAAIGMSPNAVRRRLYRARRDLRARLAREQPLQACQKPAELDSGRPTIGTPPSAGGEQRNLDNRAASGHEPAIDHHYPADTNAGPSAATA